MSNKPLITFNNPTSGAYNSISSVPQGTYVSSTNPTSYYQASDAARPTEVRATVNYAANNAIVGQPAVYASTSFQPQYAEYRTSAQPVHQAPITEFRETKYVNEPARATQQVYRAEPVRVEEVQRTTYNTTTAPKVHTGSEEEICSKGCAALTAIIGLTVLTILLLWGLGVFGGKSGSNSSVVASTNLNTVSNTVNPLPLGPTIVNTGTTSVTPHTGLNGGNPTVQSTTHPGTVQPAVIMPTVQPTTYVSPSPNVIRPSVQPIPSNRS